MKSNIILLWIIVALLIIVIGQNHINEAQTLIWLEDIELRVKSIELHLIKTDPEYTQFE